MDRRAGAIIQKAIDIVLDLPQMVRDILVKSTNPDEENGLLGSLDCKRCQQLSHDSSRKRRRVTSEDDDGGNEEDIPQGHLEVATHEEDPPLNPMETSTDDEMNLQYSPNVYSHARYTPYAEEHHMVTYRDGTREQMAMLFTEDMAGQIAEIGKESRLVEQQERLLRDLEREILIVKVAISSLRSNLESIEDEEEVQRIREEIQGHEETVHKYSKRRDNVISELTWSRRDEKLSRNRFQCQMESILAKSGLLDLLGLEPPPVEAFTYEGNDDDHSTTAGFSGEMALASDPETLLRCAAQEEMDIALEEYQNADEAFDSFDDFQWNERQD